jgi:hypothetical protein
MPYLLAVGCRDGSVLVLCLNGPKPRVIAPPPLRHAADARHAERVCALRWLAEEAGARRLRSVAADGVVAEWAAAPRDAFLRSAGTGSMLTVLGGELSAAEFVRGGDGSALTTGTQDGGAVACSVAPGVQGKKEIH